MQESLEEQLKATDTAAALRPLQNPLMKKFKMPKAGEWSWAVKGYPWGTTPKDKKK